MNRTETVESTKKAYNNRGFTLVELVVVLTILGILASMLVPALTGYIDKAKDNQIMSKAKRLLTASQTIVSSNYAKDPAFERNTKYFADHGLSDEIIELSEMEGEYECSIGVDEQYKVEALYYAENNRAAYYNGEWKVTEDTGRPGDTPIVIKGNQIQVPGSFFTEAIRSGRITDANSIKVLSGVEDLQREVIARYQASGDETGCGYLIKFDADGNAYIAKEIVKDSQSFHNGSAAAILESKGYYIAISGNKIGTNLKITEDNKVIATPYHILVNTWHNEYEGIEMQEYQ